MRKLAILGGIGYLVIFLTGIYANFFVLEELKSPINILETTDNIIQHKGDFLSAIIAFLLMVIFDFVLTYVLYKLCLKINRKLALLSALFRGINALFFGIALYQLILIYGELAQPNYDLYKTSLMMQSALENFDKIWLIGLIFFGIHLLLLAYLFFQREFILKIIALLLALAGLGYVFDSIIQLTYTNYQEIADLSTFIVILPGIIGELCLTGWLLLKGGKNNTTIKTSRLVA